MNPAAYEELFARVDASALPDADQELVLAAAEGAGCLSACLSGETTPPQPTVDADPAPTTAPAYLEEIAVEGFRGIAGRACLPLVPGAGLTVVSGRNGSGKSSFAEAVEVLLTGTTLRWEERAKVWQEGWRNLHHDGTASVSARLRVDGEAQPLTLTRTWPAGAPLQTRSHPSVAGPVSDWLQLGWDTALASRRPILSYDELGTMFSSRAADLYDALSAILGLEEFEAVGETLRVERLAREKTDKTARARLAELRERLTDAEDPRAIALLEALEGRSPSPDVVAAALDSDELESEAGAGAGPLARIELPDIEAIESILGHLSDERTHVAELERTDASELGALASLLEQGLAIQRAREDQGEPADCPLCGATGTIDTGWTIRASARADELRRQSAQLRDARTELDAAWSETSRLFAANIPRLLDGAGEAGVDVEGADGAWRDWTEALSARGDQDRLGDAAVWVRECVGEARTQAMAIHEARADAWRPLRELASGWILIARQAAADKLLAERLKRCEAWMKTALAELRADRLAPVVDGAQANWEQLRHESNVALGGVALHATGNRRYASFDVAIDGTQASALGIMSQGELSALAISIFLPRALLPGSPFGFVIIDDPVQSMDPAKVDGLARVLAEAAARRQVIVFSHDERLPEAIRRLQIEARMIRVQREARSRVRVLASSSPSERYLAEARALTRSELPARTIPIVIPGFCRSAIEAACETRIRRDLIVRGVTHAEVDEQISGLTSLTSWLAKALGYDVAQGRELMAAVERLGGPGATKAVRLARAGAHEQIPDLDLPELVRDTGRLVQALERA